MDLIMKPQIVEAASDYFKNEQGMEMEYVPMITEEDSPAIYLNEDLQGEFRPILEKFYYDESKYETYLEQLGIDYPTLKEEEN